MLKSKLQEIVLEENENIKIIIKALILLFEEIDVTCESNTKYLQSINDMQKYLHNWTKKKLDIHKEII